MKNIFLLSLFLFLSINGFGQQWNGILDSDPEPPEWARIGYVNSIINQTGIWLNPITVPSELTDTFILLNGGIGLPPILRTVN